MMTEVCKYLKNYFVIPNVDIIEGEFCIENGRPDISILEEGRYYRIKGSVFNDGVFCAGEEELRDEIFVGEIWLMRVPQDFLSLVAEIEEYQKSDLAKPTGFTSESFGGYSYSRATNSRGVIANGWQEVFKEKLKPWRRMLEK